MISLNKRTEGVISRREVVGGLAAGAVGLVAGWPKPADAEPPPETTRLRVSQFVGGLCAVPQYVAKELFISEGFTDMQYVPVTPAGFNKSLASGEIDLTMGFVAPFAIRIDAGDPIVLLAGVHPGCFELFATDRVRTVRDLRGKAIAVQAIGSSQHAFTATIVAHVGLDPRRDISWVTHPAPEQMRLLADGKIDAYLSFPPESYELRARGVGRVILNSTLDRPWSRYFCCVLAGNREFVRKHPVAAKRAIRAILKAASVCATEPERAARALVDQGFTPRFDHAVQVMRELPYGRWREFDPEDTLRFYALRLHEAGLIKSTPQKLMAQGTDWRFLNELKRELKG